MWSPNESKNQFFKKVKEMYPDASKEELVERGKELEKTRLLTYDECLARLKVAVYVGEATNDYLLEMLQQEGLITKEEIEQRYELGGDIAGAAINHTIQRQQEDSGELEEDER